MGTIAVVVVVPLRTGNRSRTQAVKGVDQKSTGLCPRRFDSCRLRFLLSSKEKAPAEGVEPSTSGSGNRRASIAPRGQFTCNRGLTVKILAFQARDPGSTPGGCTFCVCPPHCTGGLAQWQSIGLVNRGSRVRSPQSPSFLTRRAFSSVEERPFCIRKAEGSNPSTSTFCALLSCKATKSGH